MNPYLLAFVLGALGLLVMAVSGLGRHGADGQVLGLVLGGGYVAKKAYDRRKEDRA